MGHKIVFLFFSFVKDQYSECQPIHQVKIEALKNVAILPSIPIPFSFLPLSFDSQQKCNIFTLCLREAHRDEGALQQIQEICNNKPGTSMAGAKPSFR